MRLAIIDNARCLRKEHLNLPAKHCIPVAISLGLTTFQTMDTPIEVYLIGLPLRYSIEPDGIRNKQSLQHEFAQTDRFYPSFCFMVLIETLC